MISMLGWCESPFGGRFQQYLLCQPHQLAVRVRVAGILLRLEAKHQRRILQCGATRTLAKVVEARN